MDNAYHHFKSTRGVYFVTHLFKEFEMEDPNAAVLVEFGCPGHRKDAGVSLQLL